MSRILVIDDDQAIAELVKVNLELLGHQVTTAHDGIKGLALAQQNKPDMVVLDVMMPDLDGFTVCQRLRQNPATHTIPILMLTALGMTKDKVTGFDSGADDYLVKPFAFAEFLARLRVVLRRDLPGRPLFLRAGDLEMDLLGRRVSRGGEELELTGREFELLEYLLRHKNEVVTRDMIALDVWKESTGAMTRVIDVYINALRKKVDRSGRPVLIQTVRGVGYALKESL